MKFDKQRIITGWERHFARLDDARRTLLRQILATAEDDSSILHIRWLAYMLATFKRETGDFKWLHELGGIAYFIAHYGSGNPRKMHELGNRNDGDAVNMAGAGLVHLTGYSNFLKFERITHLPLTRQPELARTMPTAYTIASVGMVSGLFTGKKLSDYIKPDDGTMPDYVNARRIINPGELQSSKGMIVVNEIAANARIIEQLLRDADDLPDDLPEPIATMEITDDTPVMVQTDLPADRAAGGVPALASQLNAQQPVVPTMAKVEAAEISTTPVPASIGTVKRIQGMITAAGVNIAAALTAVITFAKSNPVLAGVIFGVLVLAATLVVMFWLHGTRKDDADRRRIAADPNLINVK